jgi:hypothetical protein
MRTEFDSSVFGKKKDDGFIVPAIIKNGIPKQQKLS